MQERRRGRKVSTEGGYIPNPYGRDLGLGYRVRTLPQGFLSPVRGTEGVVKTIEDRWGKKDIMNNQRSSVWIIYRKLPLPQSTDILWDSSQASPDARRAMPGICRLSAISLLRWHA